MSNKSHISEASIAKWEHAREKSIKALRAGWSVGAVVRAYELPERMVRYWREQAKIGSVIGKCRPTPEVGEVLA